MLASFPAVGIIGPRQAGKTTFVRRQLLEGRRDVVELDLEDPRDRAKLSDPIDYLERRADQTVVLDEVQLMPELFSVLRPLIDANRRPGRFILLGSASPGLIRGASESLAGRIAYAELTPLVLPELRDQALRDAHWLRGGYPDSLLSPTAAGSEDWRANYLETYITKELPSLGNVGNAGVLRRMLSMIAGQQGELVNRANFARALGVSEGTVRNHFDLVEQSFIVRVLPPYFVDVKKRLVKAPKAYIRDSGLLHFLAGVEDENQLRASVTGGGSWEGYVIEQLLSVVSPYTKAYFYRTHAGAEIDLVLVGRRGRIAAVEVKLSSSPTLARGFHTAREDLGPELTIVVANVTERYGLGNGVEAMDLSSALDVLADW